MPGYAEFRKTESIKGGAEGKRAGLAPRPVTVAVMDASDDAGDCGICGGPLDERHAHRGSDGAAAGQGRRIEFVVIGRRGGIADYRKADDASRSYRTDAEMLALQLGVAESTLVGRRFSCWISPAEHGTFQSDHRLIA
ncbi:hypothetical protein [Micromonospora tarensis]|uniref:Uncharacterized protein n=1 Tax=Micromonospora tarensis TaxID=2806100 RepID=A0ABS1YRY2_9ACTN|nr:hypothetical protein [Micromonospora tarensis]MBM0279899.1 hypothetical protein [Micromonospora tarensis]